MINRYTTDMIRGNVQAFLRQEGDSTTKLMPFDPKRLLLMLDTIDELHDKASRLQTRIDGLPL